MQIIVEKKTITFYQFFSLQFHAYTLSYPALMTRKYVHGLLYILNFNKNSRRPKLNNFKLFNIDIN